MNAVGSLPHDTRLERDVLAATLTGQEQRELTCTQLTAADFYDPRNAKVFDAVARCHARDPDGFSAELLLSSESQAVANWVAEGPVCLVGDSQLASMLRRLRQLSDARQLARTAAEVYSAALECSRDPESYLEFAEQKISVALDKRRVDVTTVTVGEALEPLVRELMEKGAIAPTICLPTGIPALDAALPSGGLESGRLYVVAGRPGMGKTSLGLQLSRHAAAAGNSVMVVEYEAEAAELAVAVLGQHARVPVARINRQLGADDARRVMRGASELIDHEIHLLDDIRATLEDVVSIARRLHRKNGLKLIVIDYLQLMRTRRSCDSRSEEYGEITTELKRVARELEIPIVLLSQLNRECEKRPDKRPVMSDLAQSGQIERDADSIVAIFRPWVYDKSEPPTACEFLFLKNRKGSTGTQRSAFAPEITTFAEEMIYE